MPLAQLDRASGYGPEGRGFESFMARQKKETYNYVSFFIGSMSTVGGADSL